MLVFFCNLVTSSCVSMLSVDSFSSDLQWLLSFAVDDDDDDDDNDNDDDDDEDDVCLDELSSSMSFEFPDDVSLPILIVSCSSSSIASESALISCLCFFASAAPITWASVRCCIIADPSFLVSSLLSFCSFLFFSSFFCFVVFVPFSSGVVASGDLPSGVSSGDPMVSFDDS